MAGPVRWGLLLGVGAVWWWAVLRLALTDDAGVVEGAVAAGGWGLSLLPVHCAAAPESLLKAGRRGRAVRGRVPAAAGPRVGRLGGGKRPWESADPGGPRSGAGEAAASGDGDGQAGPL
ncbi:hypothetical protein [Streptomyces sp. NPDC003697]